MRPWPCSGSCLWQPTPRSSSRRTSLVGVSLLCAAAARSPRRAPCAHSPCVLRSLFHVATRRGPRAQRTRGRMSGRQRDPLSMRSAGARVQGGSLRVRGRGRAPGTCSCCSGGKHRERCGCLLPGAAAVVRWQRIRRDCSGGSACAEHFRRRHSDLGCLARAGRWVGGPLGQVQVQVQRRGSLGTERGQILWRCRQQG